MKTFPGHFGGCWRTKFIALSLGNERKDSTLHLVLTAQTTPWGDQTAEEEKFLSLDTFQLNNSKE